MMNWCCQLCYY